METHLKKNKSRARKIKILLKEYKKLFKSYQDLANFEEPILLLIRNTRKVEFFDKATQGKFEFKHTDGKDRTIELNPQFLHTFDYGRKNFKGYIVHEDSPTPLPENPVVTGEMFTMAIDKTLNDIKKWKAEETRAWGDMMWNIAKGVAIIVGVIAVAKLLVPSLHIPFLESNTAETIVQNTTNVIKDTVQNLSTVKP